jgi:hypothetical protein
MAQGPEQLLSRQEIRLEAFRRAVFGGRGEAAVEATDVEASMLRAVPTEPENAAKPKRAPEDS